MSNLMVGYNSRLLMFDIIIHELYIKYEDPFESCMTAKTIVKHAIWFQDWVDLMPNRLDYRNYFGDADETKKFYGGQSVVFSVPAIDIEQVSDEVFMKFFVRLEYGEYFQNKPKIRDVGFLNLNIAPSLKEISKELEQRRSFDDFLDPPHEHDPITTSVSREFPLRDVRTYEQLSNCSMSFHLRITYLGTCLITEIDRFVPKRLEPFFAQEQCNLVKPYECKELEKPIIPTTELAVYTLLRECKFLCECTDADKLRMLCGVQDECVETDSVTTKQKKKRKKMKDGSTTTEVSMIDKSTLFSSEPVESEKKQSLNYDDLLKKLKGKRRGSGPMVYIPKDKPCEPVCIPCIPCCLPCYSPCCPTPYCPPPPACCYE